ncbi:MAG TPA: Hsp20/alpha crystallin family protein [Nitrospiria bacterium]|nr:Hsp20/alpha crystallin family protein [Candidatus Manganitrophaceae bacterium]
MAIVKWEPYHELTTVQDSLNHIFSDSFRSFFDEEQERPLQDWIPTVDIYEDPDKIKLDVELPGMEMKEIGVNLENNVLRICGEKKLKNGDKKDNYRHVERVSGRFFRSFTLPNTVDQEKVNATYKNGVLTVDLPKKEETKPKNIEISVQ